MVFFQFSLPRPLNRLGDDRVQLCFEIIQKQRIDDLMDVLYARVVHAALAPGFWIQRGLKHSAENGRTDF